MDAAQVVGEGNVSVTLSKLKVLDAGIYICTVRLGLFHAQQVIELHVVRKCHSDLISQTQSITLRLLKTLLLFLFFQNCPMFHSQRRSWF